jgi:hypothetical protein
VRGGSGQDEQDEQDLKVRVAGELGGEMDDVIDATKFYKSCPSECGTGALTDVEAA